MRICLFVLFLLLGLHRAAEAQSRWTEAPGWSTYFQKADVNGSFLLYDLNRDQYTVYNRKHAQKRFVPASTFKILNSMISLDADVIRDEKEVLAWDGIEREIPVWNQDHSMETAFPNSVVWFYQALARRVGEAEMKRKVRAARYGNRNIGGALDRFWLDGDLRTSSVEQIEFLVRFHQNRLPFSRRAMNITKRIMVQEQNADWTLRAKTGWQGRVGWLVGYVERGPDTYFFALNIEVKKDADVAARSAITRQILREMNLIG